MQPIVRHLQQDSDLKALAEKQKAEGEGVATAYSTVRLSPLSSELWRL